MVKRSLDNHLMGSRKTIRPLLLDRAMIQHEYRLNESAKTAFTATHQKVMFNLLQVWFCRKRTKIVTKLLHLSEYDKESEIL